MIFSEPTKQRFREFIIKIQFHRSRLIKYGPMRILKRFCKKSLSLFLSIILLPVSLILFIAGYRRLMIFTDRIGHLAIEPDTLLKAQALGLIKSRRWCIISPKFRIANQHLMTYWRKHFLVFDDNMICFILNSLSLWSFMQYNVSHFINNKKGPQLTYSINSLWGSREPILKLTLEDEIYATEQLNKLGISKNAWYVCVHTREGGFSPIDEELHRHRNSHINNLILAINEIVQRGGYVIRLGDPTSLPLTENPKIIDYAHHALRNERMDILLCAKAHFILGNTSGIFIVGSIFGVPCALANMIPMPTLGFCPRDLSIPKLYKDKKTGRYLSFSTIMSSPIASYRYAALFENRDFEIEENSAEDILEMTIEMLDRLDNKYLETTALKEMHARYMALYAEHHYSFGAISKISHEFLRKYHALL